MVILALLIALSAHATQVEVSTVACPVGEAPTKVHRLISHNQGAWDSDGARYAGDGQWREWAIATCPDNYLTLYSSDMIRRMSEGELERLEPLLTALPTEVTEPDGLMVWDRYELAGRAYEALGKEPMFLAKVYLQGSWTVRDAMIGETATLKGPAEARIMLEHGEVELAKPLATQTRKIVLFNLARLAQQSGHSAQRDRFLDQLDGLSPHSPAEEQVLRNLRQLPAVEARLQNKALTHLNTAAEPARERSDEARFLRADLLRRLGRTDEAITHFDQVVADGKSSQPLRELAAYLSAELRGERPWENPEQLEFVLPVSEER